jgi:hypothetical protein
MEAVRGIAGAQPSNAARAPTLPAPSTTKATAPKGPSPATEVPKSREPTPAPANPEV